MQRLGRVLHVSPSKNIIVRIEGIPKIGRTVVDEKLKPVGKVFDIIGPVSSPYAVVKPTIKKPEKLVDKILYVRPAKKDRRR